MRITTTKTLCMGFATLALVACTRNSSDTSYPTSQTTTTGATTGTTTAGTTGISTGQGVASLGDPNGAAAHNHRVSVTSGAPASPMEGSCPEGHPSINARDLSTCTSSCRGLDTATPPTSICVSAYDRCMIECRSSYSPDR